MHFVVDEVGLDVILDNLSHQSRQRATRASDAMEHGLAVCVAGKRALDPLDLPTKARHAGKESLFVINRMRQPLYRLGGYPKQENLAWLPHLARYFSLSIRRLLFGSRSRPRGWPTSGSKRSFKTSLNFRVGITDTNGLFRLLQVRSGSLRTETGNS
jgi:hypothetical protein